MLPIAGFEHFTDDYLLGVDDVIKAINKISLNTLNINAVIELEKKEFIKTTLHQEQYSYVLAWRLQGIEIPEYRLCITKREALKLLDIAIGKEKPNQDIRTFGLKVPEVEREGKAYSFINACFKSYKGKPASLDELIRYCEENGAVGYTEITIDGTDKRSRKVKCNEHKEGITWASLKRVYENFLKDRD